MSVISVNKNNFNDEVVKYQGVVLVDFYADWCGPCKAVAPIIEDLSKDMKDAKFVKVNVDENQDLAADYSVFSIPTFLIFKNGEVKNQFVGVHTKEDFKVEIEKVMKS
jgi:thioredoxin 1